MDDQHPQLPATVSCAALTTSKVATANPRNYKVRKPKVLWGRRQRVSWIAGLPSMVFVFTCPLVTLCVSAIFSHFEGSVAKAWSHFRLQGTCWFLTRCFPPLTSHTVFLYINWIAFQAFCYFILPGRTVTGPPTPGGQSLPYRVNGLYSWCATLGTYIALVGGKWLDASFIASYSSELVVIANTYGILIPILFTAKSYITVPKAVDIRFSGQYWPIHSAS